MELLDRYLQAVKFWLPKEQQDDIIAELSEDLRSQIEEREQQAGHKLSDGEIAELLKQRGRPLLVANRYLPQHSLIGPVLFPIYILVLKIAAICFLVPRLLVVIGFFFFDPKYHVQGVGSLMGQMWSEAWIGIFFTFGIVTLVFAVLEQTQHNSRWLEKWDPLKLPKVRDTRRIPRTSSVFEIVLGIIAVLWLIDFASSGLLLDQASIRIALTPIGRQFVWIITGLSLLGIGVSAVNLFRPVWTRGRLGIRVFQDFMSTLLAGLAARAGALIVLSGSSIPETKSVAANAAVNSWISISLTIGAAICAIIMMVDLARLIFLKTRKPQWLNQVSGAMQNRSC